MWKTKGQQQSINLIEKALKHCSIHHAYLICGPEHIGKKTLARDFAMALNCQDNNPPCQQCFSCKRINKNNHADVIHISLSSTLGKNSAEQKHKTEIGIDDIRSLQQMVSLPPYEGKYKIFIINEAESLSNEAANCLLKTLEEPTPETVILLLASDEKKMLPTIVSRCQRIQMKPLTTSAIEDFLIKDYQLDQEKAKLLSRLSNGCLGYAITAIADNSFLTNRNNTLDELFHLISANLDERFILMSKLDESYKHGEMRKKIEQLLHLWISWWQDLILIQNDCLDDITNLDKTEELNRCSEAISTGEALHFINSVRRSLSLISKNANIRLVLEVLMFHMPFKPELRITGEIKD